MRRRFARFWLTIAVGYGAVVLLLAGGMILTMDRFDRAATRHVTRIRAEENQITLAERLRWSGAEIVSTGRGYLISGDPAFLGTLDEAERKFDAGIQGLTNGRSEPGTRELVMEIAQNAKAFRARQELLVQAMHSEDVQTRAARFESELVPLQRKLGASLDRLIDYKESAIDDVYRHVAAERRHLRHRLNGLLALLVIGSAGVAAYIASVLVRSYRKEQQALETARKAVAARDEIMGVIAHDLRNPLASIAMRAELLREKAENADTKRHAEGIETVTHRMDSLIKCMLDAATLESGHFTVTPEPCRAESLIDATIEMFRGIADAKQIRLESPASSPDSVVRADRERVLQVLQNLVGNAIKFTPRGGLVTIAAEHDGTDVRFRVSDTGPGIASEHLPRMFDRFWKHEAGGKKGTGLGLFIAKGIVEAHGGRIWVESVPDHGATFCFTLPDANLAQVPARAPASIDATRAERALQRRSS